VIILLAMDYLQELHPFSQKKANKAKTALLQKSNLLIYRTIFKKNYMINNLDESSCNRL